MCRRDGWDGDPKPYATVGSTRMSFFRRPSWEKHATNAVSSVLMVDSQKSKVSYEHVRLTVPGKAVGEEKVVLDDVTGTLRECRVTALMGPSGAGKSSLLSVLAGKASAKQTKLRGNVLINDEKVSSSRLRNVTTLVEQGDILMPRLTVRETLEFAAALQLPANMSAAEKRGSAANLAEQFNLLKSYEHQVSIYSISQDHIGLVHDRQ